MKRLLRLAALGVAFLPTAVFAQTAPPAGPPGRPELSDAQRSAMRSSMEQSMQRMQQLHLQERSAMLGSLTAAHRAALATIVGNLAISPNPDREAAARQIDAILSSGEQRAILSTHLQARTQEKALRDSQRQAFLSVLTPDQRSAMDARRAEAEAQHANGPGRDPRADMGRANAMRTPDAGHVLLMLSEGGGHEHGMGGMMGERGMMGGPPGGPGPG